MTPWNIIPANPSRWKTTFGISFASRTGVKELTELYSGDGCRSRLCDYIAGQQHPDRCGEYPNMSNPTGLPLDKDNTVLLAETTKEAHSEYLDILNSLERQYGLEETTMQKVEYINKDGDKITKFVFFGDKAWQSAMWKISVYSLFIKLISVGLYFDTIDTEYYKEILKNKKLLFYNVKNLDKEIFTGFGYVNIHVYSGFHSILIGDNKTMYDLLKENLDAKKKID